MRLKWHDLGLIFTFFGAGIINGMKIPVEGAWLFLLAGFVCGLLYVFGRDE
jgi:uncharacterized membrane protein YccC